MSRVSSGKEVNKKVKSSLGTTNSRFYSQSKFCLNINQLEHKSYMVNLKYKLKTSLLTSMSWGIFRNQHSKYSTLPHLPKMQNIILQRKKSM